MRFTPTVSSIYVVYRRRHRRIINKSLKTSSIEFIADHDAFVQCVSPRIVGWIELKRYPTNP